VAAGPPGPRARSPAWALSPGSKAPRRRGQAGASETGSAGWREPSRLRVRVLPVAGGPAGSGRFVHVDMRERTLIGPCSCQGGAGLNRGLSQPRSCQWSYSQNLATAVLLRPGLGARTSKPNRALMETHGLVLDPMRKERGPRAALLRLDGHRARIATKFGAARGPNERRAVRAPCELGCGAGCTWPSASIKRLAYCAHVFGRSGAHAG
jgi:hypothetical protein